MSARKQKPGDSAAGSAVSRELIERRAYEIFRRRGGEPGDPAADWLQAEKELLAEARHASAHAGATEAARKQGARRPAPRSGA
jgi:hypothetical protein